MGKKKVYELAKELDIQSKDIVAFLQEKGIEGKVAQSALEEDAVNMVCKKFGKAEAPKVEAPKATPKVEEVKAEPKKEVAPQPAAENAEQPKKKKKKEKTK